MLKSPETGGKTSGPKKEDKLKKYPNLTETKEKYSDGPLRQATLCFPVKDGEVLLAMKRRGFAAGKWNGAGGKVSPEDKNIRAAAVRETFEEILITPRKLKKVAVLNFYFQGEDEWNQRVTVFLTGSWSGEPGETEEMSPKWFDLDKIPYDTMWDDDKLWPPKVLSGKIVEGDFLFDEDQKMLEYDIREIA